eukprot:4651999-Prymnesium_polylepis.1
MQRSRCLLLLVVLDAVAAWEIGDNWQETAVGEPTSTANNDYTYSAPSPPATESFVDVDEWARLYRARLRRSGAMARLLIAAGTVGSPAASLKAATALATANA